MVKLFCAIVGEAGSAFSVRVDEGDTVDDLKDAIKGKNTATITCDAKDLQLFLAKKDEGHGPWLTQLDALQGVSDTSGYKHLQFTDAELQTVGLASGDLGVVSPADRADGKGHVHVLVVVPKKDVMGKRTRVDEWFVDDVLSVQLKKRKEDEEDNGDDCTLKYFRMSGFPPLAHPMTKYTTIVARKAYAVIFAELMGKVKLCFEANSDANMIVTGNPGTGKSRFYLYCIFQIICRHQVEVQELSSFELVLNFGNTFHKYCAESKAFTELNEVDVRGLSRQRCVLRLIEGKSSQLTGWKGVSILFASPGLAGLNDYAKTNSYTYIVPAWSLDELQDYNSLVSGELKLSDDVLISRYNKFGGIPRFIFTSTEPEDNAILNRAFASYSALDIISYAKSKQPVKDGNFSHRVLEMVPTESDFRAEFHLDFLSQYIAEQIVSRVAEDSIQRVSEFAIAHADDDSGSTSVVRGKIYEMLCHKWFSLPKEHTLELRPLCSGQASPDFVIPKALPTVRFSSLDDIKVAQSWTYYRPTSKTFGALDAFILTGKQCLGLQMTLNRDHGIKAAPLNTFLKWLKGIGIATDQFYFAFVVPSNLVGSFQKQTIQTKSASITKKPGASASVNQFVAALDVFVGDK